MYMGGLKIYNWCQQCNTGYKHFRKGTLILNLPLALYSVICIHHILKHVQVAPSILNGLLKGVSMI